MLFPTRKCVERAVAELNAIGVNRRHIHTIAKEGIDISGLPESTLRQRSDMGSQIETILWNINLGIFFGGLAVFLVSFALSSTWQWAVGCSLVMTVSFIAGNYFASYVPQTHLEECHAALKHGEIVLLVDVPPNRVHEVERTIECTHPEMVNHGVGWTIGALRL